MITTIILQATTGSAQNYSSLLLMVGVFVIMYFTMIYPQQKRMKKEKAFRENLKKGDEVITDGGIFGRIDGIGEDPNILTLRIDDNVKVKIARASIRAYANQPDTNAK